MTKHRWLVGLAAVGALAWSAPSRAADQQNGMQNGTKTTEASTISPKTEPGAERTVRPNTSMLITGTALFVGAYGASVIWGAASTNDADHNLFIPVVGPFIALGNRGCPSSGCGGGEWLIGAGLIGAGAAQAAGLGLVLASLFVPRHETVHQAKREVHIIPMANGLAAVGTF